MFSSLLKYLVASLSLKYFTNYVENSASQSCSFHPGPFDVRDNVLKCNRKRTR